jgi:hypothetical protein
LNKLIAVFALSIVMAFFVATSVVNAQTTTITSTPSPSPTTTQTPGAPNTGFGE